MNTLYPLIQILADGKFHSGDELGDTLGITRAAVWKRIKKLSDFGLDCHSVKGKGYRLASELVLTDIIALEKELNRYFPDLGIDLDLYPSTTSTNDLAMNHSFVRDYRIVLAEHQTSGRGRRGRQWLSPFGQSISLTTVTDLDTGLAGLDRLSLLVALAVAETLNEMGCRSISVKWPNDVYSEGKKLAGILLEAKSNRDGSTRLGVGIGVNFNVQYMDADSVRQPWISVIQAASETVKKNDLISMLLCNVIKAQQKLFFNEVNDLVENWNKFDHLRGKVIRLQNGSTVIEGCYLGIDESGRLLMESQNEQLSFVAGEVSLKPMVEDDDS